MSSYNFSKTKRLTKISLLIAAAFILSWIEFTVNIPMVIPGIKLGLANIVILFTLCTCSKPDALYVLVGRLLLNALLFGNISSLLYSACGGLLSFAVMCLAMKFLRLKTTPLSILGGISHNIGQLLVACFMMKTSAIWVYLPYLIIGGTLAGTLNGMTVKKITILNNNKNDTLPTCTDA